MEGETNKDIKMKRGGCLFLVIVVGFMVIWGSFSIHIRNGFNDRWLAIIQKCDQVVPLLNQRYRALTELVQLYESQGERTAVTNEGDVKQVFTGNPNDLNAPWDTTHSEAAAGQVDPAIASSEDIHEGLNRFIQGTNSFERCVGAILIEDSLKPFWETLSNKPEFKGNELLIQLNSDLVATTPEAPAALSAILAEIQGYNQALQESGTAGFLQVQPIQDYTFPHTWPHGTHED